MSGSKLGFGPWMRAGLWAMDDKQGGARTPTSPAKSSSECGRSSRRQRWRSQSSSRSRRSRSRRSRARQQRSRSTRRRSSSSNRASSPSLADRAADLQEEPKDEVEILSDGELRTRLYEHHYREALPAGRLYKHPVPKPPKRLRAPVPPGLLTPGRGKATPVPAKAKPKSWAKINPPPPPVRPQR